jgi:hypothetical protein
LNPHNESIMYLAEDLHHRAHGSVAAGDVLSHEIIFDTLWIQNNIISPPTATNTQSLETKNSITVAYSNNQHIQKLNKNLVGGWIGYTMTSLKIYSSAPGLTQHGVLVKLIIHCLHKLCAFTLVMGGFKNHHLSK